MDSGWVFGVVQTWSIDRGSQTASLSCPGGDSSKHYFATESAMNSDSHDQRSLLLAHALPYPSPREPTEAARASRGGMESLWASIKSNLLFRDLGDYLDIDIDFDIYDYSNGLLDKKEAGHAVHSGVSSRTPAASRAATWASCSATPTSASTASSTSTGSGAR